MSPKNNESKPGVTHNTPDKQTPSWRSKTAKKLAAAGLAVAATLSLTACELPGAKNPNPPATAEAVPGGEEAQAGSEGSAEVQNSERGRTAHEWNVELTPELNGRFISLAESLRGEISRRGAEPSYSAGPKMWSDWSTVNIGDDGPLIAFGRSSSKMLGVFEVKGLEGEVVAMTIRGEPDDYDENASPEEVLAKLIKTGEILTIEGDNSPGDYAFRVKVVDGRMVGGIYSGYTGGDEVDHIIDETKRVAGIAS